MAERGHGGTLGLVNSPRFAGNTLGPILDTFILANGSLLAPCIAVAART